MYKKGETLKEDLSNLAHEQWSGWMEYLFSKSVKNEDGTVIIPKWAVDRWERQVNTSYKDLSEEEKDSDRKEADKFLKVIRFHKEKNLV
ncbi:TPA: hypothetical protein QCN93_004711 [Bacillus pacificus]|nr:hypothetical protein [Bacillus pacificus]